MSVIGDTPTDSTTRPDLILTDVSRGADLCDSGGMRALSGPDRWALAVLACTAGALTGCTADNPTADDPTAGATTRPSPTAVAGQWNAGMEVTSENVSGRATFSYADGTTRTVRFSGTEDEITDTSMVSVGQSVSITVQVEESTRGRPRGASCMIYEADFVLLGEGKISMVTRTGGRGHVFTCTWTNDGTLPTPKPEV